MKPPQTSNLMSTEPPQARTILPQPPGERSKASGSRVVGTFVLERQRAPDLPRPLPQPRPPGLRPLPRLPDQHPNHLQLRGTPGATRIGAPGVPLPGLPTNEAGDTSVPASLRLYRRPGAAQGLSGCSRSPGRARADVLPPRPSWWTWWGPGRLKALSRRKQTAGPTDRRSLPKLGSSFRGGGGARPVTGPALTASSTGAVYAHPRREPRTGGGGPTGTGAPSCSPGVGEELRRVVPARAWASARRGRRSDGLPPGRERGKPRKDPGQDAGDVFGALRLWDPLWDSNGFRPPRSGGTRLGSPFTARTGTRRTGAEWD